MPGSGPLQLLNRNRDWVASELERLYEEWLGWAQLVQQIQNHPYDASTQTEVFADGVGNMQTHDVLQAKTLTFLNNNIIGHGFIEGPDGQGCDRTDLRLSYRVQHRLHSLEMLRASLPYATLADAPNIGTSTTEPIQRRRTLATGAGDFLRAHWQWLVAAVVVPILVALLQ